VRAGDRGAQGLIGQFCAHQRPGASRGANRFAPLRIRAAQSNLITASGALRPPFDRHKLTDSDRGDADEPAALDRAGVPLRAFGLVRLEAATSKSCIHLLSVPGGRSRLDLGAAAGAGGQNGPMLIVRASRKLLGRLGPITADAEQRSTTLLGDWYATAWFWRPQVTLLVSESTLLPVLLPLAPAATLPHRFGPQLAAVLAAHRTPAEFIDAELREMDQVRLARTASRSVVGIMNEFTYLAEAWRHDEPDLLTLAVRLAATPCSPRYKRHISPDRELAALVAARTRSPR